MTDSSRPSLQAQIEALSTVSTRAIVMADQNGSKAFGHNPSWVKASDLSNLLASLPAQEPIEQRVERALKLGQILGPEYDGASFEEVATALKHLQDERQTEFDVLAGLKAEVVALRAERDQFREAAEMVVSSREGAEKTENHKLKLDLLIRTGELTSADIEIKIYKHALEAAESRLQRLQQAIERIAHHNDDPWSSQMAQAALVELGDK